MSHFLPVAPVAIPLLTAAFLAAVNQHIHRRIADLLAIAAAAAGIASSALLLVESAGAPIVYWMGGWQPRGGAAIGISFVIDPFSAGLALFAALLTLAALVFSFHFYDSVGTIFHVLMLSFLAAMSGFSLTGDVFNLFVFFELMSAAAFALCGYKTEESGPIQGALNFGITNTIGAFLALSGIGLLYGRTGALNMAQIGRSLGQNHDSLVVTAFVLISCGFLVKAAIVPFHFWLADAHAVAPTPVCILFSGIMVELGLYAVARVYWTIFQSSLSPFENNIRAVLVTLGVITALSGALMSFAQRHLKRMLAYSTISHMGLLMIAFGLLSARAMGGFAIYLAGHGLVKAALFMSAGMLLHQLGSIDELKLSGRGRRIIPGLGLGVFLAIGLSGVPGYGTFLGEGMIDHAAEQLHYSWTSWIFVTAGAITAGAVLRAIGRIYFGWGWESDQSHSEEGETDEGRETDAGKSAMPTMYVPALVLLLLAIAISFIPSLRSRAATAGMRFQDQRSYQAEVLDHSPLPQYQPEREEPLRPSIVRGILATLFALALAGYSLFRKNLPFSQIDFSGGLSRGLKPLRILHSGSMSDYVAWLTVGVAVIGIVFAALIR